MSFITAIENAIVQLGPGEFQKFCDTFLSKMDKYGAIAGLGMETGTLKTTQGNPDTYFLRDNGKYVFVVYTTQQKNIYVKIKEDIEKCLDVKKTGLQPTEIEEIVCCHTSSNLSAGADKKLHKLCSDYGIILTIYGVDEIAQQIYRNYRIIARDFLNIPIDTNQIMSVTDFIAQYDASETAAPLDTVFQNRVDELGTLKLSIRNNKAVVVHGAAGVGKTRLVLEAVRAIAQEDNYKLLCVKSNNLQLYGDLVANTDSPGRYLFFIDDANELSGLNLIFEYAFKSNQKHSIRIVMTVRDYVKNAVIHETAKYVTPCTYEVTRFTDKEIKDFLEVNIQITQKQYLDAIIEIAEGNPRIAYMAGKLAKETQSLKALHDVTEVYEQYYASIIETKLADNRNLCLTAGILALVQAVMFEKLDYLEPIFDIGRISKDEFEESIRKLSSMEVVEIHRDKVAAISDQCLANYMLYYEFFYQKRIPLSELLFVGYVHFKNGLIQSVNTLLNLFAKKELHSYIEEEVIKCWDRMKRENAPYFEDFVRVFHLIRPEEAFLLAQEKIEMIPQKDCDDKCIDFERGTLKSGEEILGFLEGYKYSKYSDIALELLMNYAQKSEDNAIIGFSWLKHNFGVDLDSWRYDYCMENAVLKKLLELIDESNIVQSIILAYVSYALSFEFEATELGRDDSIKIYDLRLVNCNGVKDYRTKCWDILQKLTVNGAMRNEVIHVLKKYAVSIRTANDTCIVLNDKPFVLEIMLSLECDSLTKALIIRDLQFGWKKLGIAYEDEEALFQTDVWKLYELLEDKWIYSELDYDDYQRYREKCLVDFADNIDTFGVSKFISLLAIIVENVELASKYSLINGAEIVINRLSEDVNMAWTIFVQVLKNGTSIGLNPSDMLKSLFREKNCKDIWRTIDNYDFKNKNEWQYYFFQTLPAERVDSFIYECLLRFMNSDSDKSIQSSPNRDLYFLNKFFKCDPDIYVTISKIIVKKKAYNPFIVERYFVGLFYHSSYSPRKLMSFFTSDMALLKDIYFFALKSDKHADYKGEFLSIFLSIDDSWIDTFAEMICEEAQYDCEHRHHQYAVLWLMEDYRRYYDRIFNRIFENHNKLSSWQLTSVLKAILWNDKDNQFMLERQEKWVMHIIEEYATDDRIICIFAALSESESALKSHVLQKFISCNSSYEVFKKLQLVPNHWGGNGNEIIADLQRRIDFLESLFPYISGAKYLKHAKWIRDQIDFWKKEIEHVEMDLICRKLYK